jgi:hypothetical protein
MFARGSEHVLGEIDADNTAMRQGFEQVGCEASSAAAGIEQRFIAAQRETRENFLAPTDLRAGEAMVDRRVPFARVLFFVAQRTNNDLNRNLLLPSNAAAK